MTKNTLAAVSMFALILIAGCGGGGSQTGFSGTPVGTGPVAGTATVASSAASLPRLLLAGTEQEFAAWTVWSAATERLVVREARFSFPNQNGTTIGAALKDRRLAIYSGGVLFASTYVGWDGVITPAAVTGFMFAPVGGKLEFSLRGTVVNATELTGTPVLVRLDSLTLMGMDSGGTVTIYPPATSAGPTVGNEVVSGFPRLVAFRANTLFENGQVAAYLDMVAVGGPVAIGRIRLRADQAGAAPRRTALGVGGQWLATEVEVGEGSFLTFNLSLSMAGSVLATSPTEFRVHPMEVLFAPELKQEEQLSLGVPGEPRSFSLTLGTDIMPIGPTSLADSALTTASLVWAPAPGGVAPRPNDPVWRNGALIGFIGQTVTVMRPKHKQ